MGVALFGLGQDARELVVEPAQDGLVVVAAGTVLRLLTASVEAAFEDLADVFGVIGDTEVPLDQDGDAGGGPQFGGPAVVAGALPKQLFQAGQQGVGQPRRSADGDGVQATGLAGHADPAMNRGPINAENLGDGGRGLAFAVGGDGALSAMGQLFWGSVRSHTPLYAAAA